MERITVTPTVVEGFPAFTVTNAAISLTIVPRLGGKISSLQDRRSGREWLWKNPRLGYEQCAYGTSYVLQADVGGWDECFPTVAESSYPLAPWQDVAMPDHGEIWSQPWPTTIEQSDDGQEVHIHTRAQGGVLPYVFLRTIQMRADSATLRFTYQVQSVANDDIAFIWSAHPLIAIEPGMQVALPTDTMMHCYNTLPSGLLAKDTTHAWPVSLSHDGQTHSMATIPERGAGFACKLWSEPLREGWATVQATDGSLRFDFDVERLPQFAVWLNASGASAIGGEPYFNMGFEPCIGAQDDLAGAVTTERSFGTLPAGGERTWWLDVTLDASQ